jgi:hypothetical protein
MVRGIYVNNEVHYFTVGGSSINEFISHQSGPVEPSTNLLNLGTAATVPVYSYTPDKGGAAMNGAVFNNKIFFAFTGNPSYRSEPLSSSTNLYVAGWDLAKSCFITFQQPNTGTPQSPYVYDFGKVNHTDSNTDFAGAAIVVFDGMLYVFSDSGTYTSADGQNWNSYPALESNYIQPLDAVTIYPANSGPLIMIVYGTVGNQAPNGPEYTSLYAANWNGNSELTPL